MPIVSIRPRARIDIAGIWEFIAEDSEAQADAFVDRFDAHFQLLARQPGLGRTRDELLAGLRSFPFERYMIFYVALEDGIDVVRVLHCARDVDAQFHPRA
jgi:toxin ParE1/3/4